MTHQQQAVELIERFRQTGISYFEAKQCALIAVELIIKLFDGLHKPEYVAFDIYDPYQYQHDGCDDKYLNGYEMQFYWQSVKTEIEKL